MIIGYTHLQRRWPSAMVMSINQPRHYQAGKATALPLGFILSMQAIVGPNGNDSIFLNANCGIQQWLTVRIGN